MKISLLKSNFFYLFFGCLILLMLFSPTSSASAESNEEWDVKLSTDTPYSIEQEDGSILFFDNESDYNSYLAEQNKPQLLCATCNQTTQTLVSSETKTSQFINYHPVTPFWTPAEYYMLTVSDSFSVTGSLKWKDVTVSVSVSKSVGASAKINADPQGKKESRLGIYSDVHFRRYHNVTKNPVGQVINSYYSNFADPVGTPSVKVVFR
ncbi:hypothetical protein LAV73_23690 [Lysinibacillus xylanilyticus]|uniref:hypothetical protein n=1 Tax=Lysinibacillus xylanilyticus TaxID=582475 RepID=UPI002B24F4D3|nr:hypothetical protein [Lysinibacillus xylanilyticus]MEB2282925.1 hypothetical protein [Lysinibacillus xylanilyticus]